MQKPKVFISYCSIEQEPVREQLSAVLQMAEMEVLPSKNVFPIQDYTTLSEQISQSECCILILYPQYEPLVSEGLSLAKFQLNEAKKQQIFNPDYKIVVWLPPSTNLVNTEMLQIGFINDIRNAITKNMVFSNALSAINLTDDIRSLLEKKKEVVFDVNNTDIFMVSNQLDESDAQEIVDLLSDIVPVESLNIIQDSDIDYSELCKQQISKSKLAVIYFKETSAWALPFAQQVWQKVGGATSHTPILLIGDEDPESNRDKKFRAPKVISLILAGELIPLEIKVQYDKVIEAI